MDKNLIKKSADLMANTILDKTPDDRNAILVDAGVVKLGREDVNLNTPSKTFWTNVFDVLNSRHSSNDIFKLLDLAKEKTKGDTEKEDEFDNVKNDWNAYWKKTPSSRDRSNVEIKYLDITLQNSSQSRIPNDNSSPWEFSLRSNLIELSNVWEPLEELNELNIDYYNELAGGIRFYPVHHYWENSARLLGIKLFAILYRNTLFRQALKDARKAAEGAEKLHLIFSGSIDTLKIPWELLYDYEEKAYLATQYPTSRRITSAYYSHVSALSNDDLNRKLNVLLIKSDVSGPVKNLDHQLCKLPSLTEEINGLTDLFKELSSDISCTVIENPQPGDLRTDQITQIKWDLIHYAGHVLYDQQGKSGIFIRDEINEPYFFDGDQVSNLIKNFIQPPRFVYLSCCEGMTFVDKAASDFLYSDSTGIMNGLVKAKVPSFLGYRWRVNSKAACEFSKYFYTYFFQCGSLREAFFLAKNKIMNDYRYRNQNICVSPVLSVFGDQLGKTE